MCCLINQAAFWKSNPLIKLLDQLNAGIPVQMIAYIPVQVWAIFLRQSQQTY